MTKIFFEVKKEAALSSGVPNDKVPTKPFVRPPLVSRHIIEKKAMYIFPEYDKIPYIQEKLERLKDLIRIDRDCVEAWAASDPFYPLLPKVKDQLKYNEKLLAAATGMKPCR